MPVRAPDSRIPLMGVPVEMPDILGTMGRVAQIKRLEAISQQEQQEMALKQKAVEEDAQVKQIFAEPGMTWEKAMPRLQQISPARALVVQKMLDEQAGTSLLNEGRQLANTKATLAQKEDEQAKAIITKYGGLTPEAFKELEALNPVRAMELKKLSLEGQPTLHNVDMEENGQTVIGNYDPKAGTVTSTGVQKGTKPDTQRNGEALALSAFAAERGKTVEQLSRAELIQAHKEWAQSDDRPRVSVSVAGGGAPGGLTAGEGGGLEYAGTMARLTGRVPVGLARGGAGAAVINEAARQSKLLGQTPVAAMQKAAAYAGDAKALAQLQKMQATSDAYESKALAQLDIVDELSDKVGRSKFPIVNHAILAGKTEILGDADATLLLNAVMTATTEYAKIMAGGTASAAAVTDSASREAAKLLNPSMSPATLRKATALMRKEMGLTMQGYEAGISHINERLAGQPSTGNNEGGGVTKWERGPDGKLRKVGQ